MLKPSDTVEKAIQTLESEALRIVLVADESGRLIGTITDGDIRRALIQHKGMRAKLQDVMCGHPITASINDHRDDMLAMMKRKELLQIPVVDQNEKIVGLETIHHLLEDRKLENSVFLMAGGFGKRLRPLTEDTPKPLLHVGSKPILETIIEQFASEGFRNFYISVHYKAKMVCDYFGDGSQWGVNITYLHEDKPLGTAGSLGLLPDDLPELPLLVMNGDLLTKVNFRKLLDFHVEQGGIATMCTREYDFQVPYGVIQADDHRVKSIIEKPAHKFFVNAGIYVLDPLLVRNINKDNYLDMPYLMEQQIDHGNNVNMFPIHEYWLDIGRMDEFEQAQADMRGWMLS